MRFLFVLFLAFQSLGCFAQNWSPLSKRGKQYFIEDRNPAAYPYQNFGREVFVNRFNSATFVNGDSVYFQNMCKPLLRGGHSDRAADFFCFKLTQTDSSFIMAHRMCIPYKIIFDPQFPEYYMDTLLQDTSYFHFSIPFKVGQIGLKVTGPIANYQSLVTSLKDTVIQGVPDSIATITLSNTGVSSLNGKTIRISKNHGILIFQNLLKGGASISQYLEPDARQKFDFTQEERRKLGPGDELHMVGETLGGYSLSLDGFNIVESKFIYKILDTTQGSVHVKRIYWEKYRPSHDPDEFEYSVETDYWTDTLNNNSSPLNVAPELGLIKPADTIFYTASVPVRTYMNPSIQKLWIKGILNQDHPNFDPEDPLVLGGLVPWFHSPHLIYSPYRYGDINHDLAISSYKYLVFSQIDGVENGTRLNFVAEVKNTSNNHFRLFPNPSTGRLNVQFTRLQPNATISIHNSLGQTLLTFNGSFLEKSLDITQIPAGVYTVSVNSEGKIQNHKLLKR
ncbi:MAG TPA: T9SS type A sorting domain-containing protein [Catalimonadaceae bacterium]|nr:T9SS type A sorting domain-containing protein [Catalimonadaceae bacterium]